MAIIPKKHEMPTQEAMVRARNFSEVALGYDKETAIAEASRCLNCKNRPCVSGCPVPRLKKSIVPICDPLYNNCIIQRNHTHRREGYGWIGWNSF